MKLFLVIATALLSPSFSALYANNPSNSGSGNCSKSLGSIEQSSIAEAVAQAQDKIDSTNWVGSTKPSILSATIVDTIESGSKKYYLVEVTVDMKPIRPMSEVEKWQYVVSEDANPISSAVDTSLTPAEQVSVAEAVAQAQDKVDSTNWVGSTKPSILSATIVDTIESGSKKYYLVEVTVDMKPIRPMSEVEKWQYVVTSIQN